MAAKHKPQAVQITSRPTSFLDRPRRILELVLRMIDLVRLMAG